MSYSDQTLITKFKSLDDTQATIVSISEWILFHHRNAPQSIKTWADYTIRSSPNQKLALFYLANEVIQKSRAKKKEEFISGFADVLPNFLRQVYPRLDPKVQLKYKRVLDIWKDRGIFSQPVLLKLYQQIKGGDGGNERRPQNPPGGQRSVTDIAPELIPLSSAYNRLSHSSSLFSSNHLKFESIYKELFDNEYNLPLPDIFISKLDQLLKFNNNSVNSLNDIVTIRESLIRDLNRVIKSQTDLINTDKQKLQSLTDRGKEVVSKRKELEEYVNGDTSAMNVDEPEKAQQEVDDDDDDEMVPTYANSDSEDDDTPPAKKQKILEDKPDLNGLKTEEDEEEEEEASPLYEDNDSESDSDKETQSNGKSINPNLASLLSKLSE